MELQLSIIGGLLMLLALLHIGFPRYFRWTDDLAGLQLINRQMLYVHTFFVALTLLLMGGLCLSAAPDLARTALGHRVCAGLAVFWGVRLLVQFVGYSRDLWRGKTFETAVHWLFVGLWTYLTAVFGWVARYGAGH